jgi:hypothetical protein
MRRGDEGRMRKEHTTLITSTICFSLQVYYQNVYVTGENGKVCHYIRRVSLIFWNGLQFEAAKTSQCLIH